MLGYKGAPARTRSESGRAVAEEMIGSVGHGGRKRLRLKRLLLVTAATWGAGLVLSEAALAAVTFVTTPAEHTNQPTATFQFSGQPTFECSLNGSTAKACATTTYLSGLPQGQNTFVVQDDCDDSGCATSGSATYKWTTDYTPPDVTLTAQPPAVTNQTTASFSFTSTDATATFQCSLNGAAYKPCSSPQVYSGLTAATRTFNVESLDPSGNVSVTTGSASWTVDLTRPVAQISDTVNDDGDSVAVALSSTESGSTFQCSLDGAAFSACQPDSTLTGLSSGSHTLAVLATDLAGNLEATPATDTFTIVGPVTTITYAQPAGDATSVQIFLSSTQAGSTFQCALNGAPYSACASGFEEPIANGENTLAVKATDPGGNVENPPATATFNGPPPPPAVALLAPHSLTHAPSLHLHRPPTRKHRRPTRKHGHVSIDLAKTGVTGVAGAATPPLLPPAAGLNQVGDWSSTSTVRVQWSDVDATVDHFVVSQAVYIGDEQISEGTVIPRTAAGSAVLPLSQGTNCFSVVAVASTARQSVSIAAASDGQQSAPTTQCTTLPVSWSALSTTYEVDQPDFADPWLDLTFVNGFDPTTGTGTGYYGGSYAQLGDTDELDGVFTLNDNTTVAVDAGPVFCSGDSLSPCQPYQCAARQLWCEPKVGGDGFLTAESEPLGQVEIVATTCPTCGSVNVQIANIDGILQVPGQVSSGGVTQPKLLAYSHEIKLVSKATHHDQRFVLPRSGFDRNDSQIVVYRLTGKPRIEGIGWIAPDHETR